MRYGQIKTEKIYWSITEVEKITGIKPHILRYWEKVIPFLQVPKNRAGNRTYRKQEVEFIQALAAMLQQENIPVVEAGTRLRKKTAETSETVNETAVFSLPPASKTPNPEVLKHLRAELLDAMARLRSSQKKAF